MSELTQLGNKTAIPDSPHLAVLEKINNHYPDVPYCVRLTTNEFTSRCPITAAPDFATIVVDYIPGNFLLESKSAKLFFNSFRDHGSFHEQIITYIGKRIYEEVSPSWVRVAGFFAARGGVPIDVFFSLGSVPKSDNAIYIPELDLREYRAR